LLFGEVVEVAPSASLWIHVCCSYGNKWGICRSKSFNGTRYRCCGTEWSCDITFSENPLLRWR